MPHVIIKMYPGRSEEEKERMADAIVQDIMKHSGAGESSVSVAIEEIEPSDWKSEVYDVDIRPNLDKLYKKPGYKL
ncbi:MAG: tautomerase family protein [Deferribacterales bacterium]